MKVCHLTSVHIPFDPRIFHKQCRSLARAGYEVHLVVAGHDRDEVRDGVHIHGVRKNRDKLRRMVFTTSRVFRKAMEVNAGLYHFHDPELIPIGLALKLRGKRVVYDIHEDYSSWLTFNSSIPPLLRKPAAWAVTSLESVIAGKYDALVTVTPEINHRFQKLNDETVMIRNFPIPGELGISGEVIPWDRREATVCYVGALQIERGVREMVEAVSLVRQNRPLKLLLYGTADPAVRTYLDTLPSEKRELVEAPGPVGRDRVREILTRTRIGLIIHHPVRNFLVGYPTKLFEYMSAGLPVICSDLPVLRALDEGVGCCMMVDPLDPSALARAIEDMLDHPEKAEEMGRRGRHAVETVYSWKSEEQSLLALYARILGAPPLQPPD